MQAWWIAPIFSNLAEIPLMLGATLLTAFNDNAAITFLATLVPGFTERLKYAVVAGTVTGGGLTIIANAPNPAGLPYSRNISLTVSVQGGSARNPGSYGDRVFASAGI